uniref:Uncharacterized protein n=2 Tax=Amphimedon queenslandica TaxID=400682 RepID=A0A1X7VCD9_AMPQE
MSTSRLSEVYGGSSSARSYMMIGDTVRVTSKARNTRLADTLKEVFLPQGYPNSVSEDYLQYQLWDTLQAFCSYITGTLATHAMLKGVGVGDSSASPVAATLTWILKDGLGMTGRILFAWLRGYDLDCNAKKWRLIADILNDIAICMQLVSPFFPSCFLLIACLASITQSVVGVAGGATRAALVQHQARRDNMADVSAKDGSQETLVNLCGLLIGLIITPLIAGQTVFVWSLFFSFTLLHLYSNYKAVSVVSMETLNCNRLHLLMRNLFLNGTISEPNIVNREEPLLFRQERFFTVEYGSSLSSVLIHSSDYSRSILQFNKGQKFIIKLSKTKRQIRVAFHCGSSSSDQLKAGLTVELIEFVCGGCYGDSNYLKDYALLIRKGVESTDESVLVDVCQDIINDLFSSILDQLRKEGWTVSHHLLGIKEWRYNVS